MLRKLCLFAVGSCCLLVPHTTYADAKADAQRQIQAAYDQYANAVAWGDVTAIMRVTAPGYSSVDINGQVTRRSDKQERRYYV